MIRRQAMAGIFTHTTTVDAKELAITRMSFDFADNDGHELRIQYVYEVGNRRSGYFEMWRTDGATIHPPYRVLSHLLDRRPGDTVFSKMITFDETDEPKPGTVAYILSVARTITGWNYSNSMWRVPREFADVEFLSGVFTDCLGYRYLVRDGVPMVFVDGKPPIFDFDDEELPL